MTVMTTEIQDSPLAIDLDSVLRRYLAATYGVSVDKITPEFLEQKTHEQAGWIWPRPHSRVNGLTWEEIERLAKQLDDRLKSDQAMLSE